MTRPLKRKPGGSILGRTHERTGLCQKAFVCAQIARQTTKSKSLPYPTGVRWLSASRKPAHGSISAPGFPSLPATPT